MKRNYIFYIDLKEELDYNKKKKMILMKRRQIETVFVVFPSKWVLKIVMNENC